MVDAARRGLKVVRLKTAIIIFGRGGEELKPCGGIEPTVVRVYRRAGLCRQCRIAAYASRSRPKPGVCHRT